MYVLTEEYYGDYQQFVSVFDSLDKARKHLEKIKDRTDKEIHWRNNPDYDYVDILDENSNELRINGCCHIKIWRKSVVNKPTTFPGKRIIYGLREPDFERYRITDLRFSEMKE